MGVGYVFANLCVDVEIEGKQKVGLVIECI